MVSAASRDSTTAAAVPAATPRSSARPPPRSLPSRGRAPRALRILFKDPALLSPVVNFAKPFPPSHLSTVHSRPFLVHSSPSVGHAVSTQRVSYPPPAPSLSPSSSSSLFSLFVSPPLSPSQKASRSHSVFAPVAPSPACSSLAIATGSSPPGGEARRECERASPQEKALLAASRVVLLLLLHRPSLSFESWTRPLSRLSKHRSSSSTPKTRRLRSSRCRRPRPSRKARGGLLSVGGQGAQEGRLACHGRGHGHRATVRPKRVPFTAGPIEELTLGSDRARRCSGDMLLESLVACTGVTLKAVATSLDIPVKKGAITAEGDLDFRYAARPFALDGAPFNFPCADTPAAPAEERWASTSRFPSASSRSGSSSTSSARTRLERRCAAFAPAASKGARLIHALAD